MAGAMKDSGIEWMGEIPDDWDVVPVKRLFDIGRGRVIAKTELTEDALYPVFSSQTQNDGCLGYLNTYDFNTTQLTWTTDGANAGAVFLRQGKHNCTNVCGTLAPKSNEFLIRYTYYALSFVAQYHKRYDINGFKIMNNEMAVINITLPPNNEQESIADYLDFKCSLIDSVIEKQKAVIEKVKLYKQSIITEAVTKGLDPNVTMKPSGIELIGDIPVNWDVVSLGYEVYVRARLGWKGLKAEEYVDDGYIFLATPNIKDNNIDFNNVNYISRGFCIIAKIRFFETTIWY